MGGGHLGFPIHIKNRNLVKDIPMIIHLQFGFSQFISFFEISANQSILLALAAMLNIRLERKTETLNFYSFIYIILKTKLTKVNKTFYQFTWTKGPWELLPSLGICTLTDN
jgi:hypothetical protein